MNSHPSIYWQAYIALALSLVYGVLCLYWWIHPENLSSDSFLYRWIYYRFFSWGKGVEAPPKLSPDQIKLYTAVSLFVCLIVAVLSIWILVNTPV